MNQQIKAVLFVVGATLPASVGVGSYAASVAGCSPAAQQEAKAVASDALTASQLACILATALTSAPEVAQACKIDMALLPVIEPLLDQKAAAKRAGACEAAAAASKCDGGTCAKK